MSDTGQDPLSSLFYSTIDDASTNMDEQHSAGYDTEQAMASTTHHGDDHVAEAPESGAGGPDMNLLSAMGMQPGPLPYDYEQQQIPGLTYPSVLLNSANTFDENLTQDFLFNNLIPQEQTPTQQELEYLNSTNLVEDLLADNMARVKRPPTQRFVGRNASSAIMSKKQSNTAVPGSPAPMTSKKSSTTASTDAHTPELSKKGSAAVANDTPTSLMAKKRSAAISTDTGTPELSKKRSAAVANDTPTPLMTKKRSIAAATPETDKKYSALTTTDTPTPVLIKKRSASLEEESPTPAKRTKANYGALQTPTTSKKTRGTGSGVSTNKKAKPTERSSIRVNPGSAVIDGPFTAFPRPLSAPELALDESIRDHPIIKNIVNNPVGVGSFRLPINLGPKTSTTNNTGTTNKTKSDESTEIARSAAPVSTPTLPARSTEIVRPAVPAPNPTLTARGFASLEELNQLRDWLKEQFDERVDEKNEAGIVLSGRERDKLFNRITTIPKLFIETFLGGIDRFKNECLAWDTAMNSRQLLQRRDFFRDKIIEVDHAIEDMVERGDV